MHPAPYILLCLTAAAEYNSLLGNFSALKRFMRGKSLRYCIEYIYLDSITSCTSFWSFKVDVYGLVSQFESKQTENCCVLTFGRSKTNVYSYELTDKISSYVLKEPNSSFLIPNQFNWCTRLSCSIYILRFPCQDWYERYSSSIL